MTGTTIGVLALQGDVREHCAALEAAGARAVLVRRLHELAAIDGLVIPGGESTTMSRLLEVFELYDPIAQRIALGMPVYGSCAGMIMLASSIVDGRNDQRYFGAIDMMVRRNAFGRQVDSFETELVVTGIPGRPVQAVFIRAPWVDKVGSDVEVLARVHGSDVAMRRERYEIETAVQSGTIVAVRQGNALATSFHPELTGDYRVHALFIDMVRSAR